MTSPSGEVAIPAPLPGPDPGFLADRPRNRLAGIIGALLAGGIGGLACLGESHHWNVIPVAAGIFVAQLVVGLAWPAALGSRGSGGSFLIGLAAAGLSDSLIAAYRDDGLRVLAAIVGLSLIVGLLHQLIRRPRPEVVGSLAATLSLVLLEVGAATPLALRAVIIHPDQVIAAGMFGVGAALLIARLFDLILRSPPIAPSSSRGLVGVVFGIVAAGAVGAVWGHDRLPIGGVGVGLRIAVVGSVLALIGDLALDVAGADPQLDERSRSALVPLTVLLPIMVAGPAIYIAARYLLG